MSIKKFRPMDLALIGMMVAILEAGKFAMNAIPNVEIVSFWIIIFTMYFGKRVFYAVGVFILLEGILFGFGIWWVMYLYVWPVLCLIAFAFRKKKSIWLWSVISGLFGLIFGFLCSFTYMFIGTFGNDFISAIKYSMSWFVAGLPWDLVHSVSNFIIIFVLYYPITKVFDKLIVKVK